MRRRATGSALSCAVATRCLEVSGICVVLSYRCCRPSSAASCLIGQNEASLNFTAAGRSIECRLAQADDIDLVIYLHSEAVVRVGAGENALAD